MVEGSGELAEWKKGAGCARGWTELTGGGGDADIYTYPC